MTENEEYSILIIDKLVEFIEKSESIAHLDFSGMCISMEHLLRLSNAISGKSVMMGVHFSDNGINQDLDKKLDILDCFGIQKQIFNS